MATVTAYLGLCGSGKSYLERHLTGAVVIDESFFDKTSELIAALRAGKDCAITEIAFCQKARREWLVSLLDKEAPGTNILWRPIEKNKEKANRNCRLPERTLEKPDYDAEAHVRMNDSYCLVYEYPEGVPVLPMWPYDDAGTSGAPATQS